MSEYIVVKRDGAILELVIARTKKKNALNVAMYRALSDAIDEAVGDVKIRTILLRGSDGCFCAGNDLADFASGNGLPEIKRFMQTLLTCPKPVVVAVEGAAIGIGATLLLHADLVYASGSATFHLPFVGLGLCPEYASSYLLPRMAGHLKASELLLLGEPFGAELAKTIGMVNEIVDNPVDLAKAQCAKLAKLPPKAVRNTKALLKVTTQAGIEQAVNAEIDLFIAGLQGPEFAEAATAFFEKRPTDFSSFE
ncbi:MAG: enoyl-CoA hydratase [Alteromonadaceae bacterium]|nr:MAG: enoyl-CoA hydratase [Alteromonadaceae bacterium]